MSEKEGQRNNVPTPILACERDFSSSWLNYSERLKYAISDNSSDIFRITVSVSNTQYYNILQLAQLV